MATLNVRLDDKLKKEAYAVLEKLDMTPTEAVRLLFQYIAENGRMPVKSMTISDGEAALLRTVRERLENPRPGVKVLHKWKFIRRIYWIEQLLFRKDFL